MNFVLQKVLVRDLFCGEISNNVVSLVRKKIYIRDWILLVKACPNRKCLATKHDQILFGDQTRWCCTEWPNCIKYVWTSTMFFNVWGMIDVVQGLSNTIQHDQTRCLNGKCLVTKQVDRVWWPNISRLDRALSVAKTTLLRHCVLTLETGESHTCVVCMVFL